MKLKVKQRFIGALVLLALVAIFLPLFFHSARPVVHVALSTEIPDPPTKPADHWQAAASAAKLDESAEDKLMANLTADHAKNTVSQSDKVSAETTPAVTQKILKVSALPKADVKPSNEALADTSTAEAKAAANVTVTTPHVQVAETEPHDFVAASKAETKPEAETKATTVASVDAPQSDASTTNQAKTTAAPKTTTLSKKTVSTKHRAVETTEPLPEEPPEDGVWILQVATFSNKANADRLLKQLQDKGLRAYTQPGDSSGRQVTRVYVGPVASKSTADGLQQQLKATLNLSGVVKRTSA